MLYYIHEYLYIRLSWRYYFGDIFLACTFRKCKKNYITLKFISFEPHKKSLASELCPDNCLQFI